MSEPVQQEVYAPVSEPTTDLAADMLGEAPSGGADDLEGFLLGEDSPVEEPAEEVERADEDVEDEAAESEGEEPEDEAGEDDEEADEDSEDDDEGEAEPEPQKLSRRAKERAKWQAQIDEASNRAAEAEKVLGASQGETARAITFAQEAQQVAAAKDIELQLALGKIAAFEAQGHALDPLVVQNLELQKQLLEKQNAVQASTAQAKTQQATSQQAEAMRIVGIVETVSAELGADADYVAFKVGDAIRKGAGRDEASIRSLVAKLTGKKRVKARVAKTKPTQKAPSVPKPKKAPAKRYDRGSLKGLEEELMDDPNIR